MDWRERLARALWERHYPGSDPEPGEALWVYGADADAILSAIDAAGCAIVPKEATEEMRAAASAYAARQPSLEEDGWKALAWDIWQGYRAMLAARPK